MAHKAIKNFTLSVKGVLDTNEDGRLIVSIEDRGEFDLLTMLDGFMGRECSISVKYDEDYEEPMVDSETGEVLE